MQTVDKKVAKMTFLALTAISTSSLWLAASSMPTEAKETLKSSSQQFIKCGGGDGADQERKNRRKLRKARAELSSLLDERRTSLANIASLLEQALATEASLANLSEQESATEVSFANLSEQASVVEQPQSFEFGLKALPPASALEQALETVQATTLEQDLAAVQSVNRTRNVEADIASVVSSMGGDIEFLQDAVYYLSQRQFEALSHYGMEIEVHVGSLQEINRNIAETAREVKRLERLVE